MGAQERIQHLEGEIQKLKAENKKRRKMIEQQQMLIESGASSYYKVNGEQLEPLIRRNYVLLIQLTGHINSTNTTEEDVVLIH